MLLLFFGQSSGSGLHRACCSHVFICSPLCFSLSCLAQKLIESGDNWKTQYETMMANRAGLKKVGV